MLRHAEALVANLPGGSSSNGRSSNGRSRDARPAGGDQRQVTSRHVGILTTDTALVVSTWDAALAAMTGIAVEEARGRPLADLVPDLEPRGLLSLIRDPLVTGAPQVLAPAIHQYLIPCPPTTPCGFDRMQQRVVIGALRDEQRIVGLAITIEDVTARVERERRLAASLRNADPAVRLRAIEEIEIAEPLDGWGRWATCWATRTGASAGRPFARWPDARIRPWSRRLFRRCATTTGTSAC